MDAHGWDERYAATDLVWSARPNQFVESELGDVSPGRALDLAAGEGRNALWLAERGWEVTAVDFSQVGLDKGRQIQAHHERGAQLKITWVCADVLSYDPGPSRFDLALLAYLQLPADERRAAVRRAFSSLELGGTFLLVAHDSTNLSEGAGGPQDPAVLYTAEEVLGDLDGERFDVARAERVAREVSPAEPGHRDPGEPTKTAYDALVKVVRTA